MSYLTLAVLAITILALLLRLPGLDRESLWLDEGYTLLFSGLPLPRLITVGGAHEHPPLYYLLVHGVMAIWPSYLVPRFISAVAGGLSVPVLYLLGRRLCSPAVGIAGALLLAISPFHIWYSQDGRAYELAGLCVLLSYMALVAAEDRPRPVTWCLYVLATLAALYTEYTTVLALAPQALFLLRARRPLVLSWLAIVLGYSLWIGVALRNTASVAAAYWIPAPGLHDVLSTGLEFLGLEMPCPSPPCTGQQLPFLAGWDWVLVLAAAIATVFALAWAIRRRSFPIVLLCCWLLLPFAIILSLATVRSLYLDRVFLDATYPLYLLIGAAIAAALSRRWAVPVLAVALALVAATAGTASLIYATTSNPDWRSLARDLEGGYRPGQAVMFNPGVLRSLVGSYLPPGWHATRERALWSRSYIDVPGWQRFYPGAVKTDQVDRARVEALLRDRQLADVSRGSRLVWLVTYDYPGVSDTRRWFIVHGFQPLLSEIYAGDTRLELWGRSGPASLGRPVVAPDLQQFRVAGGQVTIQGQTAIEDGRASLTRAFRVRPGEAYSVDARYQAMPPAGPAISVTVYDRSRAILGTFPSTKWYDLPVTGVWLRQPFGFVAPPGAYRAVLTVANRWGETRWRAPGVYGDR